ncbi:hypothetical protein ACFS32_03975 [Novosphingobium pokkalii]
MSMLILSPAQVAGLRRFRRRSWAMVGVMAALRLLGAGLGLDADGGAQAHGFMATQSVIDIL